MPSERRTIEPLAKPPKAAVSVPGSKSLTNRALLLGAMRGVFEVHNALRSEDTELMVQALEQLHWLVDTDWGPEPITICRDDWGQFEPEEFLPKQADLF